uniref:Uncharacterized protein n=1 Tax=Siphoviridae sp. cteRK31 TaxID=2826405 RepID=A0A8S5ML62_9CAUD|nr:MAG TPA: hypothetical protein [Siphoviridae sp. cteRK31]
MTPKSSNATSHRLFKSGVFAHFSRQGGVI